MNIIYNRNSTISITSDILIGSGTASGHYDTYYTYDRMGNITSLTRIGLIGGTAYSIIDNLDCAYEGNRLTKVEDSAGSGQPTYYGAFHFDDGADSDLEYAYDANGNMTRDLNKGITEIKYNLMNLPAKITYSDGKSLSFTYSANGERLSVTHNMVYTGDFNAYFGPFIYRNGSLQRVLVDGGYITLSGGTKYHYYLKDHLGNNRMVVRADGTVEQVTHYYPYGGLMGENTGGDTQPYKYNGKELERTNGLDLYDYGARWMDSKIGARFTTMDPMCEKYYDISPYAYCAGNPIRFVDPNGCLFGDYYNLSGKYIGTDGIDDDKYYFVLNAQEQKTVKKNDKNKSTTELSTLSSVIEVPSNAVIERIEETYKRSETSGNEHGFQVGIKGTVTSITEGSPDAITNWDDLISELKQAGDLIAYDVHAHTLGNEDFYGKAEPSPTDIQNVVTSSGQPSIVLGYEQISPFPNL